MENTRKLSEAAEALFAQAMSHAPCEEPPQIDWEAESKRTMERFRQQRTAERLKALERRFPEWLAFDLNHKGIAPNRAKCESVTRWEMGKRGLVLKGTHGCGKSRSVFALCLRLVAEGVEVAWWNAQDLAGRICEEIDYGADDARKFIQAISETPVLVIDDLGNEDVNASQKPRVDGWLLRIYDQRLTLGKPTITTTNKASTQYHAKYGYDRGAAIVRRMVEEAEVLVFE